MGIVQTNVIRLLTLLTFGVVQNSYLQIKKFPPTLASLGNRSPKKGLRGGLIEKHLPRRRSILVPIPLWLFWSKFFLAVGEAKGLWERQWCVSKCKGRYTRGVLLPEHAPGSFCMCQYTRGSVFKFAQFASGACFQIFNRLNIVEHFVGWKFCSRG